MFISEKRRERLTIFGLAQMLERYSLSLGFKCNPHMLRRTCATECLRSGMSIYLLQKLLGHEDLTVLKHYVSVIDDDLREAHQKFGLVDNI